MNTKVLEAAQHKWRRHLTPASPEAPHAHSSTELAHFDAFVARIPLLPYFGNAQSFYAASPREDHVITSPTEYQAALRREQTRLADLISDPIVQEAIYIASPSLYERLHSYRAQLDQAQDYSLQNAILRYIVRMSTRCTPFGLFAGNCLGKISDSTELLHSGKSGLRPTARLDMGVIHQLVRLQHDRLKELPTTLLRANNTRYTINAFNNRYVEGNSTNGHVVYSLANFESTRYIELCLQNAADGAAALSLAQAIIDHDAEISLSDALAFVSELVRIQLLVPDVEPPVTCEDPLRFVVNGQGLDAEKAALLEIQELLQTYNRAFPACIESSALTSKDIDLLVRSLPLKARDGQALQVDSNFISNSFSLSQQLVSEIASGTLAYFSVCNTEPNWQLAKWKHSFSQKYGTREIDLSHALDEESGIAFVAPDNKPYEQRQNGGEQPSAMQVSALDLRLLGKVLLAIESRADEIVLSDDDVKPFSESSFFPASLAVLARLADSSDRSQGETAKHLVVFNSVVAPCGTQLLGRFCSGNAEIYELTKRLARHEAMRDVDRIYAEIVHIPQGRLGNIISRPPIREFELPYFGKSCLPEAQQIAISDLSISVVQDRVVLRSKSRNVEVVPRLSSAHNPAGSNLSLYQFLCALQMQSERSFSFSWGSIFSNFNFLPRIRFQNCIFTPARWRLDAATITGLKSSAKKGAYSGYLAVQELQRSRNLPRIVSIAEGDNVMTFNLKSPASATLFLDFLDQNRHQWITEVIGSHTPPARDRDDNFYNAEIIVPFFNKSSDLLRRRANVSAPDITFQSEMQESKRLAFPGGRFAYLKIYGSPKSIDNFVVNDLNACAAKWTSDYHGLNWFFVRYVDPDFHIRLRFTYSDERLLWSEIVPRITNDLVALQQHRLIERVQLDTYERELERYGGSGNIELCEAIFCIDSLLCSRALAALNEQSAEVPRWHYALFVANYIAESIYASQISQLNLFDDLFVNYARALGTNKNAIKASLSNAYRRDRGQIELIMQAHPGAQQSFCHTFYQLNAHLFLQMREALKAISGVDAVSLRSIVGSIIHMAANRLYQKDANREEASMYYYLVRAHESSLARRRSSDIA